MNNNELSIESQRRLTEALGEVYHEPIKFGLHHHQCACGQYNCTAKNPDFEDGRVTVRLMGLVDAIETCAVRGGGYACWVDAIFGGNAATREIAIAKAVDAYLLAKEKCDGN